MSGARKIMRPFFQVHGHQVGMVGDRRLKKVILCATDKQKESRIKAEGRLQEYQEILKNKSDLEARNLS